LDSCRALIMNTEQLILQELRALSQKVEQLEKEIKRLKEKAILLDEEPVNPFRPKGGDIWGGLQPPKNGKDIIGHEEIIKPLVFNTEALDVMLEVKAEYERQTEKLLASWKDKPETAPQY